MKFRVFDGCIAPVWDTPYINKNDESLSVKIRLKDEPYELSFPDLSYKNSETNQPLVCGIKTYSFVFPDITVTEPGGPVTYLGAGGFTVSFAAD